MRNEILPIPSPGPSTEPDPFNLDPSIWPEAPGWLFPTVMTALALALIVVAVLIGMWIKAVRYERVQRAAAPPKEWVDLSKLDKKGRWEDLDDNPRTGGIERDR